MSEFNVNHISAYDVQAKKLKLMMYKPKKLVKSCTTAIMIIL